MEAEYDLRQIEDTIEAGLWALETLRNVEEKLQDVSEFSVLDLIGGNLINGLRKQRSRDGSRIFARQASQALDAFRGRLRELFPSGDEQAVASGFLEAASMTDQSFFEDAFIQSNAQASRDTVGALIREGEYIIEKLRRMQARLEAQK